MLQKQIMMDTQEQGVASVRKSRQSVLFWWLFEEFEPKQYDTIITLAKKP